MPIAMLKRVAPPAMVSAARSRLAAAIVATSAAAQRRIELDAAYSKYLTAKVDAEADVQRAGDALKNIGASVDRAELIEGFMAGRPLGSGQARSAAKAAVEAAEERLAGLSSLREAIEAESAELNRGGTTRRLNYEDALVAVIAEEGGPVVAALMTRASEQLAELSGTLRVLWWLSRHGVRWQGPDAVVGLSEWCSIATALGQFSRFTTAPAPGLEAWQAAFEKLKVDAAAELPRAPAVPG